MWETFALAGLVVWLAATVWVVRRLNRGQQPYVDPYDWQ